MRIAELSRKHPEGAHTTLAHHIDVEFLKEAYRRTREEGAVRVDGQSAADYAVNLGDNLAELLERFKSGGYYAPPVRRVHIPCLASHVRPRESAWLAAVAAHGESNRLLGTAGQRSWIDALLVGS